MLIGVALIALIAVIAALLIAGGSSKKASASEVLLQSANTAGPFPWTGSLVPADAPTSVPLPTTSAPASTSPPTTGPAVLTAVTGNRVGIYGGTLQQTVCDKSKLTQFLEQNPAQGAAWASVEGISPSDIPSYIDSLTSVILSADTRVTNHGFRNGHATTLQSVLQAGTAVLVDKYGVPRARCYCGNPLLPPVLSSSPAYTGPPWPGFDPGRIIVVQPAPAPMTQITVININGGGPVALPTGGQPGRVGGQQPAGQSPGQSRPGPDTWAGTWERDEVPGKHLFLSQNGTTVSGTFDWNDATGKVNGSVSGATYSGTFRDTHYAGTFVLTLAGRRFTGSYTGNNLDSGGPISGPFGGRCVAGPCLGNGGAPAAAPSPPGASYNLSEIRVTRTYAGGVNGPGCAGLQPGTSDASVSTTQFQVGWTLDWDDSPNFHCPGTKGFNHVLGTVMFTKVPTTVTDGSSAAFAASMHGDWSTKGYGFGRDRLLVFGGALGDPTVTKKNFGSDAEGEYQGDNTASNSAPVTAANNQVDLQVTAEIDWGSSDYTGVMQIDIIYTPA